MWVFMVCYVVGTFGYSMLLSQHSNCGDIIHTQAIFSIYNAWRSLFKPPLPFHVCTYYLVSQKSYDCKFFMLKAVFNCMHILHSLENGTSRQMADR